MTDLATFWKAKAIFREHRDYCFCPCHSDEAIATHKCRFRPCDACFSDLLQRMGPEPAPVVSA